MRAARGLIIAAPHSGAGKTTVTLALLAALKRRGLVVRAAKAGPDYIDPAFHAAVTGSASVNLDSWAMPEELLDTLAARTAGGADVFVIEGVMGLFDGAPGLSGRRGATADLAARFALPVVLVLDVARQAQSAAAVRARLCHPRSRRCALPVSFSTASAASGIAPWSPTRSRRWAFRCSAPCRATRRWRCRSAISASCRPPSTPISQRFARSPRRGGREPSRSRWHHGRRAAPLAPAAANKGTRAALPPPGQRIALARDRAFSFVYPHLIDGWRRAGAEIAAVLAACRRAAAGELPMLLAAGRLSGAARRRACGARVSRGTAALRANAPGAWRVRRLHGAGRRPGRRRGRAMP